MSKEITVTYELKRPTEANKYVSEKAGVYIQQTVEDDAADKFIEEAFKNLKLQVFAELEVAFDQSENGVLVPVIKEVVEAPKKTYNRSNAAPASSGGFADKHKDKPQFDFQGTTWVDFRAEMARPGNTMSSAHPAFKSADGKQSYWLTNKEGDHSQFFTDALAEGVITA